MPCLTINGVTIPVFHDSIEETIDDIGEAGDDRALLGNVVRSRIGRLRRWHFSTPLLTAADAEAYRKLLEGNGHAWSFVATANGTSYATHLSSLGLSTSYGATWTPAATGGKLAGKVTVAASNFFAFDLRRRLGVMRKAGWDPTIDGYTVMVWRREGGGGGTWNHTMIKGKAAFTRGTANPAGVKQVLNGTINTTYNFGRVFEMKTSANYFGIFGFTTAGVAADVEYSDLVVLPYEVPDAWVSSMFVNAQTKEFSKLPYVLANGFFSTDSQDIEVLCRVLSIGQGTGNVDGSGVVTNNRTLEVDMMENI